MSRPETGSMRFGDDWTGVFIRGDSAAGYAIALEEVLAALETREPGDVGPLQTHMCQGLLELLQGSRENTEGVEVQDMIPFHIASGQGILWAVGDIVWFVQRNVWSGELQPVQGYIKALGYGTLKHTVVYDAKDGEHQVVLDQDLLARFQGDLDLKPR